MSKLAELRARVARSVDRVAATRIRITPLLPGEGYVLPEPDPTKPPFEIDAVVSLTTRRSTREGAGASAVENLTVRGKSVRVSIALGELVGKPALVKGWRVTLLEQPGEPELAIANFEPPEAAHGRLIAHLGDV